MATTTTTTTLEFKSYKGGERRAVAENGNTYSIVRKDEGVFDTRVQQPGQKGWTPLGTSDAKGARHLADDHLAAAQVEAPAYVTGERPDLQATQEAAPQPPTFVQEGASDRTVAEVLDSIVDPEVEDVRRLVAQTDDAAAKASKRVDDQAKRAAQKAEKAKATKAAKVGQPAPAPVELQFEAFRGDEADKRAKGARHVYRVTHASSGAYYAAQRQSAGFTHIAGKCETEAEAMDLAQRYENGARQLSHRQFNGMPYAKAIAQLDGK